MVAIQPAASASPSDDERLLGGGERRTCSKSRATPAVAAAASAFCTGVVGAAAGAGWTRAMESLDAPQPIVG